eukprot:CAMPEP_0116057352 /NCGR_PEP_ID=MMETSP0322-20121206/4554_1 /TAXON_ID=163516 /ORGANISM="Leptocylindrus danicus var. apora, Strain B651" /LENGTH=325 /DNA_ID=CAMNT_0003541335 /DNA_START=1260 /DNA_END=2237 /DNA_ORIENTATION=+
MTSRIPHTLTRNPHLTATAALTLTATLTQTQPTYNTPTGDINLTAVKHSIIQLIETNAEQRDDGTSLVGTFVRLAWHASGTYSQADHTGGSQGGRMRFDPEASFGANAGLNVARAALESVKAQHPAISYADLYCLSGVAAIEHAGGPAIEFELGREDAVSGESSPPDGRLPDADKGSSKGTIEHVREVFYRMGFGDREIVALLGAHALGRCHTDRSGYWGPWTFAENTMSNEYFRLLVEERWSPKTMHNGKPWTGPDQFEDSTGKLMMLPSDIALIRDPSFRKYVEMYAKDEDLFFKDFAQAFSKLLSLGVPLSTAAGKPWYQFW